MSYCTLQDLIDRYGNDELIQLSDRVNAGTVDTDVINRAIADADGEIDGYLAGRFAAPITPIPKSLVRIGCEIARYYLYDDGATEQVSKRYNDAVSFLKGISKGDISIGITAAGEKPASKNTVQMTSGGNVFSRKDKGFM